MAVLKIIVALATVSAVSASCTNGKCDVDDTTSFIQYKQSVTSGEERESDNVIFEKFMLEESEEEATMPAGCVDVGCVGSGPHCGGNEDDCTSHGFLVKSFHKSCDGIDTCVTGYKARCMQCGTGSTATSATYPAPAPGPALYVEPAPAPTPAPAAAAAALTAPVMPTNMPVYTPAAFDAGAVGNATLLLKHAMAHAKALALNYSKAEKVLAAVKKNISTFKAKEEAAQANFKSNRDAAVAYSKKKEMANITKFKAEVAMNSAYFAQKGAEKGAQDWAAKHKNFDAERRYFEKLLVDKHHLTQSAQSAVELAQATVTKAKSDLADAEAAASAHKNHHKEMNEFKVKVAEEGVKVAQELAVKKAEEKAWKASGNLTSAGEDIGGPYLS